MASVTFRGDYPITANKDIQIIVKQENYFHKSYRGILARNNRRVINNKISIREIGRLRSSGISIRTWQILPNENLNKRKFLETAVYNDGVGRIKPLNLKTGTRYSFKINEWADKSYNVEVIAKSARMIDLANQINTQISELRSDNKWTASSVDDQYIRFDTRYGVFWFDSWSNFEHVYSYPERNLWFKYRHLNHKRPNNPYMIKNTIDYKKVVGSAPKKPQRIKIKKL